MVIKALIVEAFLVIQFSGSGLSVPFVQTSVLCGCRQLYSTRKALPVYPAGLLSLGDALLS